MQVIEDLKSLKEIIWYNPKYSFFDDVKNSLPINLKDAIDAEDRAFSFNRIFRTNYYV